MQIKHVGPYDQAAGSFQQLDGFVRSMGLGTKSPGHEIYINDPARVPPAKLKTSLRLPASRI